MTIQGASREKSENIAGRNEKRRKELAAFRFDFFRLLSLFAANLPFHYVALNSSEILVAVEPSKTRNSFGG